jgi:hypothetical protein
VAGCHPFWVRRLCPTHPTAQPPSCPNRALRVTLINRQLATPGNTLACGEKGVFWCEFAEPLNAIFIESTVTVALKSLAKCRHCPAWLHQHRRRRLMQLSQLPSSCSRSSRNPYPAGQVQRLEGECKRDPKQHILLISWFPCVGHPTNTSNELVSKPGHRGHDGGVSRWCGSARCGGDVLLPRGRVCRANIHRGGFCEGVQAEGAHGRAQNGPW